MSTNPAAQLDAAKQAFIGAGGTIEQWDGGVKRAIEAEIAKSQIVAIEQDNATEPKTPIERAMARMRNTIRI